MSCGALILVGVLLAACGSGESPAAGPSRDGQVLVVTLGTPTVSGAATQLGDQLIFGSSAWGPSGSTPPRQASPRAPGARDEAGSAAQPSEALGFLGQRVESGGIALTVAAVREGQPPAAAGEPRPLRRLVIADVLIENLGREQLPYGPSRFTVSDADRFEYQGAAAPQNALAAGALARGEQVRGSLAFAVSPSAHGLVLAYQPLTLLGDAFTIRVPLD